MSPPRLPRRAALALPGLLLLRRPARAAWPERPVRLIVPFPAGSGTDILARLLAEPLGQRIGQPVVADNRPGGNGVVGAQAGAMAAADGYTLLILGTSAAAINPHTVRRLPYDPLRDFAPIGMLAEQPYVLAVGPNSPARDLAGFLALGHSRAEGLTFATGNAGSIIMAMMIGRMAGIRLTGVPYRGGAEALADVAAGRVAFNLADFGPALAQREAGRVRLLAQTLAHPFPLAPEIPPIATALPGFDANVWFSLVAPAATPPELLTPIGAALDALLAEPATAEKLARIGLAPLRLGRAETTRHFEQQLALWGERVRNAGTEPQ
ncbi:Bug family tripartite tricarboxylate transporter substrate binding protein [Siccirubricoccus phaeus]|uniref:Bug family tripartite tricarboxylate transporter substrate binding protein n=1 Tax=Siccirubricoccus phaeus TaxID=2595053 RepID=UPI0011F0A84F|nr:tripartite tricarboxylate transporter substrate binding protein [Siccirubricoccus phaeus]